MVGAAATTGLPRGSAVAPGQAEPSPDGPSWAAVSRQAASRLWTRGWGVDADPSNEQNRARSG